MKTILIGIMLFTTFNVFSQSVILTNQQRGNDFGIIKFPGTTTVSSQMAETMSKEYLQPQNNPNTFQSSIICDFTFFSAYQGGRGKIWNITDNVYKIKVTCLDCENIQNNTLIIEVKPRTFSRIMFDKVNQNNDAIYRKIKCEITR